MLVTVLIIYFLFIIIFSRIKFREIQNPYFNLFKSMFPSWKLYDESSDTPILLYKIIDKKVESENNDQWKICFPPPKVRWFHLLLNPKGNLYLAYHSNIQQLLGDLENCLESKLGDFHQNPSYQIAENFVRHEIRKEKILDDFQFKISNIKMHDTRDFMIEEDILISPILTLQSEFQR